MLDRRISSYRRWIPGRRQDLMFVELWFLNTRVRVPRSCLRTWSVREALSLFIVSPLPDWASHTDQDIVGWKEVGRQEERKLEVHHMSPDYDTFILVIAVLRTLPMMRLTDCNLNARRKGGEEAFRGQEQVKSIMCTAIPVESFLNAEPKW